MCFFLPIIPILPRFLREITARYRKVCRGIAAAIPRHCLLYPCRFRNISVYRSRSGDHLGVLSVGHKKRRSLSDSELRHKLGNIVILRGNKGKGRGKEKMKKTEDYVVRRLEDEYLVLPSGRRTEEVNEVISLSETAGFIYMHAECAENVDELAITLCL